MQDQQRWGGPDVTVVIAAYNAAATIDQALASVVAQSEPPGRVVIVDDCSTDDTVDRARRWSTLLSLDLVELATNGGPAVARHRAIERAETPLVSLLDADDFWFPDHLETLLDSYAVQPGVVTADALPWVAGSALAHRSFGRDHPLPEPPDQLTDLIRRNVVFMGTLMDRDDYLRVGGFRAQFRGTEDWDLWIRMARAGIVITRPNHPTVLYRMNPGSLSARDSQLDADLAVVTAGQVEAGGDRERRAFRAKRRQIVAQRHLFDAYGSAERGASWQARRRALRALAGQRRVALRALGMALAPRVVAGWRGERRFNPRWWFRRL